MLMFRSELDAVVDVGMWGREFQEIVCEVKSWFLSVEGDMRVFWSGYLELRGQV